MTDIILAVILLLMIAVAAGYVIKAKRSGAKCIGCAVSDCCAHHHNAPADNAASPSSCGGCGGGCSCCHSHDKNP